MGVLDLGAEGDDADWTRPPFLALPAQNVHPLRPLGIILERLLVIGPP